MQMGIDAAMSEQREEPRTQLAPKGAKVVCQTGEYLCMVQDVSLLGAGLRFLHAVPPEPRILLQMPNGLTYPIERVWIGKRQAGYRFGCEVTLEEFTEEDCDFAARAIRLEISASARIGDGRKVREVSIENLSSQGARFNCDEDLPLNCLLGFDIRGLEKRLGQIRWRDGKTYGKQFQHALSEHELADCALELQPFGSPFPNLLGESLKAARAA